MFNTTWTLCGECPRERTWVVFAPEDWVHHLGLAGRILLISSWLAAGPVRSDVGELRGAIGWYMEPIVQCSTLANRVRNPLSQSLWTIIEGYHDPLLCAYVSERRMSRAISVSPDGPLLMAVMTSFEARRRRARDRENQR